MVVLSYTFSCSYGACECQALFPTTEPGEEDMHVSAVSLGWETRAVHEGNRQILVAVTCPWWLQNFIHSHSYTQISTLADHNEELMKLKHAGPWSELTNIIISLATLKIIMHIVCVYLLLPAYVRSYPSSLCHLQVFRTRMLRSLAILTATGRASSAGDSIHTANENYAACFPFCLNYILLWLWISVVMIAITLIAIYILNQFAFTWVQEVVV